MFLSFGHAPKDLKQRRSNAFPAELIHNSQNPELPAICKCVVRFQQGLAAKRVFAPPVPLPIWGVDHLFPNVLLGHGAFGTGEIHELSIYYENRRDV